MNNKEILDNAPEGATHVEGDENPYYFRESDHSYDVYINNWEAESLLHQYNKLRSLADIKRIVDLERALIRVQIEGGLGSGVHKLISDLLRSYQNETTN
jgi:hypothetical protein